MNSSSTVYAFDFDGDGIDDATTSDGVLDVATLGLDVGTTAATIAIYENGGVLDRFRIEITVDKASSSFDFCAAELSNGNVWRYEIALNGDVPISEWRVDWGDGCETRAGILATDVVAVHRYVAASVDQIFAPTLTTVDANGKKTLYALNEIVVSASNAELSDLPGCDPFEEEIDDWIDEVAFDLSTLLDRNVSNLSPDAAFDAEKKRDDLAVSFVAETERGDVESAFDNAFLPIKRSQRAHNRYKNLGFDRFVENER